ncbi:MAG: fructose-bisphosphate aldolase class I [Pseudomonadota bacterium]|nr:fructose-bisphosphate aldolase class I [Pseudomonadota bacterium]
MSKPAQEMTRTVAELTARGKGVLAADESTGTIEKRFKSVNVPCTEETRRDYRGLLFSTPGLGALIGGVILFEETLKQRSADDVPLPQLLNAQGIVPGIKVDKGTISMPGFPGEKVTQGLDGLAQRLTEYKQLGARFAKWRAVISIGAALPTAQTIAADAHALAQYAAICQEQGLVPIVEPEVLMDGDHSLATCQRVTEQVLHAVFHALHRQRVVLECMLLKPNMVVPGDACPERAAPEQVAQATLECLRRTVPAAVPGVYFLSGGQDDVTATVNLNAINAGPYKQPWVLSFSYGRALQAAALNAWRGQRDNTAVAQQALYQRARLNSAAREGTYTANMENDSHAPVRRPVAFS